MSARTRASTSISGVIFAMGGGGFTMEPANPLLDDFVLVSAHAQEPRVLFLPTAVGRHDRADQRLPGALRRSHCACPSTCRCSACGRRTRPLEEIVLGADIIYVGGGSMRNLLAIWRAHGLDRLLVEAWRAGTVLAGLSAGAMCWFQGGVTRSSGPPEPLAGLGLLDGSLTVHADGEPERLPVWLAAVRDGTLPGGWALDDGVGLLFAGAQLARVVSSRPGRGRAARRCRSPASSCATASSPSCSGDGGEGTLGGIDEAVEELRRVHRMRRGIAGGPRRSLPQSRCSRRAA